MFFFFFNDTATTEIYTLSLHDALPICPGADGVPMGKWVAEGTSGGTTMGYYERAAIPVQWRLAEEVGLPDHYFQGVHGGGVAEPLLPLFGAPPAPSPPAPPGEAAVAARR